MVENEHQHLIHSVAGHFLKHESVCGLTRLFCINLQVFIKATWTKVITAES